MAGQPMATEDTPERLAGVTWSGVNRAASAPAAFMPSSTAPAMASVLPVPLQ